MGLTEIARFEPVSKSFDDYPWLCTAGPEDAEFRYESVPGIDSLNAYVFTRNSLHSLLKAQPWCYLGLTLYPGSGLLRSAGMQFPTQVQMKYTATRLKQQGWKSSSETEESGMFWSTIDCDSSKASAQAVFDDPMFQSVIVVSRTPVPENRVGALINGLRLTPAPVTGQYYPRETTFGYLVSENIGLIMGDFNCTHHRKELLLYLPWALP